MGGNAQSFAGWASGATESGFRVGLWDNCGYLTLPIQPSRFL